MPTGFLCKRVFSSRQCFRAESFLQQEKPLLGQVKVTGLIKEKLQTRLPGCGPHRRCWQARPRVACWVPAASEPPEFALFLFMLISL